MAIANLGVPGVYVQERRFATTRALPTGVPVFVGLIAPDASMPPGTPANASRYGPIVLRHKNEFLGGAAAFLGSAVDGFFDNGGAYCYVVAIKASPADALGAAAQLINALATTSALDDVDLVAIPDALALRRSDGGVDENFALQVQRAMVAHCGDIGTRVALLDALPGKTAAALIGSHVKALGVPGIGPVNAALYHPWIRTVASSDEFVPPSGQIAGIISRTDASDGPFTAPANTVVQDATDVEIHLDADSLAALTTAGVNCIRAFPSRGIRVWGARTLSADAEWAYVSVRRLALTILRWIDANMTWATFEPNVPALWARIERELNAYLAGLWRAGALQGTVASDAFRVRCDAELNPPDAREIGRVVTEIRLAPTAPAEFILVTVQHRAGTTELT
jgi:phage tail sheath protein FI